MSFRADIMIEKLKDFPDNVVAVAFHGQVTALSRCRARGNWENP
jgi:hypothetical protein